MSMENSLIGKRILFIGIGFYDYDQAIKIKLEELGGEVTYVCSVCKNRLYRLLKSLGLQKLAIIYSSKIRRNNILKTQLNQDYIFIIKGECLEQTDIDLIKTRNPSSKSILYFWDDIQRINNRSILLDNFSNIWSFDSDDCIKYGFKFRPLFYRDNIKANYKKKYLLSSIGWCHTNRLKIFREIACQLKKENKAYFLKLYVGYKTYFVNRYIKKTFLSSDEELLTTKPIKYSDVMKIISASIYVLDVPHPSQRGLSIRTIEALKLGCHVITTNTCICEYNDISSSNYTILFPNEPLLLPIFSEHQKSTLCGLSQRYSLNSFIQELFQ